MPRVNPEILRWARETAGLTPEEAAKKLDLGKAHGLAADARLISLEAGETEPSRAVLVRMAKQYRRPLVLFYLPHAPKKGDRGQDFRSLPADSLESDEAILDALLRDVLARQALLRAAVEDEDEPTPLTYIGVASLNEGIGEVVKKLRETLELPLSSLRAANNPDEAFQLLRSRVEALGTFVLLLSNLGSHHTSLGVETFRGFALADPIAPFVVINDQDSRSAWSFTLVHELVHLLLGESGISGGTSDRDLERFCNDVASEFLLPSNELSDALVKGQVGSAELIRQIGEFARVRNVSRSMVAYRLYRANLITSTQWNAANAFFREQWLRKREREREKAKEESGGPSFYVVRRHRLGQALLETTGRLLQAGALTTSKAGRVLGVKPTQVESLLGNTPKFVRPT